VGLVLAACIVVATLVLQSTYGAGAKLVVARWAAARFNIAVGKSAGTRPAGAIYRSSGGRGGNTTASNALASDRTARRRANNYCSASRSHRVAANDGAPISRIWSETSNSSRRTSNR